MEITATRINHNRKGSNIVFSLGSGFRGTLKGARSLFGEEVPESFTVSAPDGAFATAGPVKAKLTKEERAAARAAMTPQMKVARAKELAAKAAERAAKLEASLAASL